MIKGGFPLENPDGIKKAVAVAATTVAKETGVATSSFSNTVAKLAPIGSLVIAEEVATKAFFGKSGLEKAREVTREVTNSLKGQIVESSKLYSDPFTQLEVDQNLINDPKKKK